MRGRSASGRYRTERQRDRRPSRSHECWRDDTFWPPTKLMPTCPTTAALRLAVARLSIAVAIAACRHTTPPPAAKAPPPSREEIRQEMDAGAERLRLGHNPFFGEAPLTELPVALADPTLPPDRRV